MPLIMTIVVIIDIVHTLFIVECKTYGREYEKEYKNIVNDGGQLFSYWQQERSCKFLVLYASKYEGKHNMSQRLLAYQLQLNGYDMRRFPCSARSRKKIGFSLFFYCRSMDHKPLMF